MPNLSLELFIMKKKNLLPCFTKANIVKSYVLTSGYPVRSFLLIYVSIFMVSHPEILNVAVMGCSKMITGLSKKLLPGKPQNVLSLIIYR